jgi:uncharacterized surface protein with fasciclin (FAS1) repeats
MSLKMKLAAAVLALSLGAVACGDDATEDDTSTETTEEATTTTEEETETTEEETTTTEEETTTTEGETETSEDGAAEPGTIVEVATEAGDFTVLLAAAQAAGLVDTLNGPGPLTVFAPTDAAFEAALADLGLTADELLADTDTLTDILTYHVVEGAVLSTDLSDGMMAPTVNGAELTISVNGGVMVDDANVTTADVLASNGVIHVIDKVLLPPS